MRPGILFQADPSTVRKASLVGGPDTQRKQGIPKSHVLPGGVTVLVKHKRYGIGTLGFWFLCGIMNA